MTAVIIVLAALAGAAAGFAIARARARGTSGLGAATEEVGRLRAAAEADAGELRRAAELEGKEAAQRRRAALDDELRARRAELGKQEDGAAGRERDLDKARRDLDRRQGELDKRERAAEGKSKQIDAAVEKAEAAQAQARAQLEATAGLTAEQARKKLEDEVRGQAQAQAAADIKRITDEAERESQARAKTIIATAIQRFASEFVAERTVAVVPLPSDDLKGRLIGREGRNIRALEAATGVDMIIDDTAESISISCFNPVRREIARLAISALVADGRIHPTRIEEVVKKAEKDVEKVGREAGEQAAFDLGLHRVHPEMLRVLGQLRFRSAHAQNLLAHSVEVGYLAGLMAAELGLNVKLARRAGLLHDIGKGVDHEQEGNHADVGAQLARKHGESPRVCQAIAAHHGDVAQTSMLDVVVDAANQLSAARPGARRETLAGYIKRLEDVEAICTRFEGVHKAFALQAGREVRVMVQSDKVDDARALVLSKDLARAIEAGASYPGQVRVVVVRETRASDYAR